MYGHGQGRVRGQRSLSHPSRESHGRKARVSKAMQEQAGVTRKLPRSGLVQPLVIKSFCPDKPILAGLSGSVAPCSLPVLAGRYALGYDGCQENTAVVAFCLKKRRDTVGELTASMLCSMQALCNRLSRVV